MKSTIQVQVGRIRSKSVEIGNGTPQGGVISPVLFNIMINDLVIFAEGLVSLYLLMMGPFGGEEVMQS